MLILDPCKLGIFTTLLIVQLLRSIVSLMVIYVFSCLGVTSEIQ